MVRTFRSLLPILCLCQGGGLPAYAQKVSASEAQRSASRGFRPASFHGIQTGRSVKDEVIQKFGKPNREGLGEDGSLWVSYKDIDGVSGLTEFVVDPKTSVVLAVAIGPTAMRVKELSDRLGKDYVLTRWSISVCDDHPGYSSAFLDSDGPLTYLEYRHLGVSALVIGDRVSEISYSPVPFGVDRDPCGLPPKKKWLRSPEQN